MLATESQSPAQRTARKTLNLYYVGLSEDIETTAKTGNLKSMYTGIKNSYRPHTKKQRLDIRSNDGVTLTKRTNQMNRWIEHFSDCYDTERPYTASEIDKVPSMEIMEELDDEPQFTEMKALIARLSNNKASGIDAIPADLIKAGRQVLLSPLYSLLLKCWRERTVPLEMRDSNIITLCKNKGDRGDCNNKGDRGNYKNKGDRGDYNNKGDRGNYKNKGDRGDCNNKGDRGNYKNKGDRGDCNNYRGTSLLSVVGRIFARIILTRLQTPAERVYPDSHGGFRSGRGTVDMILCVSQLQEKVREQQMPLHVAFVDLTKAFDYVNREALFTTLKKVGCPPILLDLTKSFHENLQGTAQVYGMISDHNPFPL